jgi:3-mercaptopyruvate sulfurtransferase SseA
MVPVSVLTRAMALLAVGCGLGLAVNAVRPDGLALRGFAPAMACSAGAAQMVSVESLPPEQVVRMCGDPGVLLADARPPERFSEGHVADAVHLPCAASGTEASSVVARLGAMHTLIVYGDTTEEARPVAEDLRRRIGRADLKVVVLEGGFSAWNKAGLACASGPCPDCGERASLGGQSSSKQAPDHTATKPAGVP